MHIEIFFSENMTDDFDELSSEPHDMNVLLRRRNRTAKVNGGGDLESHRIVTNGRQRLLTLDALAS